MCQFQQHYVAGEHAAWSIELVADDDLADGNANGELVRLRLAVLSDNDHRLIDSNRRLEPAVDLFRLHSPDGAHLIRPHT